MHWEEMSSADGFAMSMIGILALALGIASMVILTVMRNCRKTASPEDLLIEEAHRQVHGAKPQAEPTVHPRAWERDADWWKAEARK